MIQIVPVGHVAREDLLDIAATTRRRFGVEAVLVPAIPAPPLTFRVDRAQHDADALLEVLFDRLSLDVCRVIGVTEHDLFAEGRDFVFGYAHMRDRVAIFSTQRLNDGFWGREPNLALYRTRVEKALVHELGHTFQAAHCSEDGCVMQQVEHLWQLDALSPELCAACAAHIAEVAARSVDHPDALFELGGSYMRRRRFSRAVAAYGAALAADPANAHYANDLGVALLAAGDRTAAVRAFERAIRLAPDLPQAYYNLGIVVRGDGDPPRADLFFAEAIARDADARQAHRYLGILHQDYFHDAQRAAAYFQGYVALGGDDLDVQRRLRLIQRDLHRCMQVLAETSFRAVLESGSPV